MTNHQQPTTRNRPWAAMLKRRGHRQKAVASPLVQVNLVLTEELREWLDALAVEYQHSRSDVARALLGSLLKKQRRKTERKDASDE